MSKRSALEVGVELLPPPMVVTCNLFFFSSRRRHTRLQGDWSSDVCSSDLRRMAGCAIPTSSAGHAPAGAKADPKLTFDPDHLVGAGHTVATRPNFCPKFDLRSEERRVGKECRSRWSPYH